jgi:hypothetical protein
MKCIFPRQYLAGEFLCQKSQARGIFGEISPPHAADILPPSRWNRKYGAPRQRDFRPTWHFADFVSRFFSRRHAREKKNTFESKIGREMQVFVRCAFRRWLVKRTSERSS